MQKCEEKRKNYIDISEDLLKIALQRISDENFQMLLNYGSVLGTNCNSGFKVS